MSSDWATPAVWRLGLTDAEGLERALWGLVAFSLVGDIVTTFVGLHIGLAESNPIARTAIEGWGVLGMIALKAGAVAIALACRPLVDRAYRPIIPAALAIPWTAAVLINLYMISLVA
ncbi:DUF5658 family protein [Halovivax sp.]|uniref:DUF5658 family protein n=1 Tax=Halovivax sp. TaxID=1935978 RepID=UPI0025C4111E|nr:DUF5658 family protein [Halovivax sp.]